MTDELKRLIDSGYDPMRSLDDHSRAYGNKPWHEGGREDCLERGGITMSHDELLQSLPAGAADQIEAAGFVLVPKKWRDNVLDAASKACARPQGSTAMTGML